MSNKDQSLKIGYMQELEEAVVDLRKELSESNDTNIQINQMLEDANKKISEMEYVRDYHVRVIRDFDKHNADLNEKLTIANFALEKYKDVAIEKIIENGDKSQYQKVYEYTAKNALSDINEIIEARKKQFAELKK